MQRSKFVLVAVCTLVLAASANAGQRDKARLLETIGEELQRLMPGKQLLIFAGRNHDEFLGCLNCSRYSADSVHNDYGKYGNAYSGTSLKNEYSKYGNEYNALSPCNEYSTTPPVVVDASGTYYGELTVNEIRPRRITHKTVVLWLRILCSE
jgi:hypothetical protein